MLRYKLRYSGGFIALIAASVMVMLPPVVIGRAIDSIEAGTSRSALLGYTAIILALALVEGTLRFGARLAISGAARYVEYDLRTDMADHFMRLDQSFYIRSQTGDLMARATNDLQRVRDLTGPASLEILRAITMMLIGFVFMLTIDVQLALIALAYFPIVGVLIARLRLTVERKYRLVSDQFGVLSNRVQENISGMQAIKAYAQEDSEVGMFAESNRELMRRTMSWSIYMGAFWPLMFLAAGASIALVLWFGGRDVVRGDMTIGDFVQFNAYMGILTNPLISLGWTLNMFQQGVAGSRRVSEIFAAEPKIVDPLAPSDLQQPKGEIEFRNVTFGYYDKPVLKNLNLRIPAGKTIALVGGTGAGKTTLVNLLVRLYDPWEGQVLLDGVDIRELPLSVVRQHVGFVPQETFLFSDTLRENVSLGGDEASEQQLDYAFQTSQLVNDVGQLTHGIETILGERGATLSGGQKQRTALARALLKAPPVIVLDDALSHVDTHTEEEILRRLHEFMAARTTILIAHRTSTLATADFVAVLDEGRIAELGTQQELLAHDGIYARFYKRQLLTEQLEEGDGAAVAGSEPSA